jgi:DnaK suppressor protein
MTEIDQKKFRRILEAKRQEIEQAIGRREGLTVERTADALDEVRQATEAEVRIRNLDRESSLLHEIREALSRIEAGSFGICLNCEDEIKPRRLAAVPWTPLCIHCQTDAERNAQSPDQWEGSGAPLPSRLAPRSLYLS